MRCSEVFGLVAALRECKDFSNATQLHQQAVITDHSSNKYVVSSLINMYSRLGNMSLARQVFDEHLRLDDRNVVAWTALMMGYVDNGEAISALELFHLMQERAGCTPNSRAFLAAIRACTALATKESQDHPSSWLELGRALHSQAVDSHCCNIFVESALVDLYSKSGSMILAQSMFDGMATRNIVSWTALLQGYVDNGQSELALELFGKLEQTGLAPDARIYVVALRACSCMATKVRPESSRRWLDKGREIHSQAVTDKLLNLFVESSLIGMYAACGSMAEARRVFESVAHPDVVCWNSLLQGYAENEHSGVALELFSLMEERGSCVPDSRTYVAVLSACMTLENGRLIHSQAASGGCVEVFVEGVLVQMYARCGGMIRAQLAFDSMASRSAVSWSALLRGYVENGESEMVLELFDSDCLRSSGHVGAYLAALMACVALAESEDGSFERRRWLAKGKAIHSLVLDSSSNVCVESALIDMYSRCGRMADASFVFDSMASPDLVSWNALLHGYVRNGEPDSAMELYTSMTGRGLGNSRTLVAALSACATLSARKEGREISSRVVREPEDFRNSFVDNTLIDMYSKCGSMVHAQLVFDSMDSPDVVSWTALATGYIHNQRNELALDVLAKLPASGTQSNSLTFVAALEACGNLMALETGKEFHEAARTCGLERDAMVANSLVTFYGKCGRMDMARQVFDSISRKSVVSWTALMCGYSSQGDMTRAFEVLESMREQGVEPSEVTFVCLLAACSQSGLVDKGMEYFEAMSRESPGIRHYNCIIDLLGRGSSLPDAMRLVRDMPVQPNAVTWTTILSSCESVSVGRSAFQSLLKLDEKDGTAHVLMSNIHRSQVFD